MTAERPDATAALGRPVPVYHCPFCAEEDLRPAEEAADAWTCLACARTFTVRLVRVVEEAIPGRVRATTDVTT